MSLKITFVNPNTEQEVDKYLPKILAEALINKVVRELNEGTLDNDPSYSVKQPA